MQIETASRESQAREALESALGALDFDWSVLAGLEFGAPPDEVAVDFVAINRRRGVALVDAAPGGDPAAAERFRALLRAQGFETRFPGRLPVVHLRLGAEAAAKVGQRLEAALAAEPPITIRGDAWVEALAQLLTDAEPEPRAAPVVPFAAERDSPRLNASTGPSPRVASAPSIGAPPRRRRAGMMVATVALLAGLGAGYAAVQSGGGRELLAKWRGGVPEEMSLAGTSTASTPARPGGLPTEMSAVPDRSAPRPLDGAAVPSAAPATAPSAPSESPPAAATRRADNVGSAPSPAVSGSAAAPGPAAAPVIAPVPPAALPPPTPIREAALPAAEPSPAESDSPPLPAAKPQAPSATVAAPVPIPPLPREQTASRPPEAPRSLAPPREEPAARAAAPSAREPAQASRTPEPPAPRAAPAPREPQTAARTPAPAAPPAARQEPSRSENRPIPLRPGSTVPRGGPPMDARDLPPLDPVPTQRAEAPRTGTEGFGGSPAGAECRPYTAESSITGSPRVVQGLACRQPDGRWKLVTEQPAR